MKTKNTFGNLADELSEQLLTIQSTVQVCGFAAEARRVLNDIDDFLELHPTIEKKFDQLVEFRNEWLCHPDSLALVLRSLSQQIGAVNARLSDPEVHRAINNP